MDAQARKEARLIVGIFGVVLVILVVPILVLGSSMTTFAVILGLLAVAMVGFAVAGRHGRLRA